MKTTNYEISKKLKKIGFQKEATNFYWFEAPNGAATLYDSTQLEMIGLWQGAGEITQAYDLETILEALPKKLINEFKIEHELEFYMSEEKWRMAYVDEGSGVLFERMTKEEDESIADTAARLLLLLVEKKIINFNEVKNDE